VSLLKAQVRVAVTNDIGADLDDQLEQARREAQQQEGAKAAYATAQKAVEQLLTHLKKDIEDGKYGPEQGVDISRWIQRAMAVCDGLGAQATQILIAKNGALAQNERLVSIVKKRLDGEVEKLRELELLARAQRAAGLEPAQESDPTAPSAPKSIKQIRLEEAAREAEAAAQAAEPAPTPPASANGKVNGKRGKGSRHAANA
jgi:hypothetical protein